MAPKVWCIGDPHFSHANIIKYCNRPFKDVDEMNRVLIGNWNQTVSNEDTVILVGDVALGGSPQNAADILNVLKGTIIVTRGNHDGPKFWKEYKKSCPKVTLVDNYKMRDPNKSSRGIFFSHYPTDKIPAGYNVHICGHTHDKPKAKPGQFNVSVELIGYRPINLEVILDTIEVTSLGFNGRNPSVVQTEQPISSN